MSTARKVDDADKGGSGSGTVNPIGLGAIDKLTSLFRSWGGSLSDTSKSDNTSNTYNNNAEVDRSKRALTSLARRVARLLISCAGPYVR